MTDEMIVLVVVVALVFLYAIIAGCHFENESR
jgi:hypothetical protein